MHGAWYPRTPILKFKKIFLENGLISPVLGIGKLFSTNNLRVKVSGIENI